MSKTKITVVFDDRHDYFLEVMALLTGAFKSEVLRDLLIETIIKYKHLFEDFEKRVK